MSDENTDISQIDLVPPCSNGMCSKKLLTSMGTVNISNCTILWEEKFIPNSEPFGVEDRNDAIYFMVGILSIDNPSWILKVPSNFS